MLVCELGGRHRQQIDRGCFARGPSRHRHRARRHLRLCARWALLLNALIMSISPNRAIMASKLSASSARGGSEQWATSALKGKTSHRARENREPSRHPRSPPSVPSPASTPMDSVVRARALDQVYGYKGWNIPFPSFGDSLTLDTGNWRSMLASYGFGLSLQSIPIAQGNILDTPRKVPAFVPPCQPANLGYNCAGGRSYFRDPTCLHRTLLI